jgi:hypothetical protein
MSQECPPIKESLTNHWFARLHMMLMAHVENRRRAVGNIKLAASERAAGKMVLFMREEVRMWPLPRKAGVKIRRQGEMSGKSVTPYRLSGSNIPLTLPSSCHPT